MDRNGKTFWTPDNVERLAKLAHLSDTEAARELGCTKGTVSGRRYRVRVKRPRQEKRQDARLDWDRCTFETWAKRKARLSRKSK
jgi:hypothetical protein